MKEPEYEIGQYVYHTCADGTVGIVLDIRYSFRNDELLYQVTFGNGGRMKLKKQTEK